MKFFFPHFHVHTWPLFTCAALTDRLTMHATDLCGLVAQVHPVRRGKVHRLRHAVTAAHFGDKGTRVADHKLAAPLHRAVNLDAFAAQHLWRDLR